MAPGGLGAGLTRPSFGAPAQQAEIQRPAQRSMVGPRHPLTLLTTVFCLAVPLSAILSPACTRVKGGFPEDFSAGLGRNILLAGPAAPSQAGRGHRVGGGQ